MIQLIAGSALLSVLHALIPSHWLPILAISRKEQWTPREIMSVTFISGLAHTISTILLGLLLGAIGIKLSVLMESFTDFVLPALLIVLGLFYIIQHHRHKHFHVHISSELKNRKQIIISLVLAMFFSPCLEIEAYFVMAGTIGWWMIMLVAGIYAVITIFGMMVWIRIAHIGLMKINWHSLEHNAGIITGSTLVATGIISIFIY